MSEYPPPVPEQEGVTQTYPPPTPQQLKSLLKRYRDQASIRWQRLPSGFETLDDKYVGQGLVDAMKSVVDAYDEVDRLHQIATAQQSIDRSLASIAKQDETIRTLQGLK